MAGVVVGLDGSASSREAFRAAVDEASRRDTVVRAVHIYSYPTTVYSAVTAFDPGELHDKAEAWLARELETLIAEFEIDADVKVTATVRAGHPGAELIDVATDADLLILGSRGLGGFRGLLLGSVSTYCLHHMPCPVLVIPTGRHSD